MRDMLFAMPLGPMPGTRVEKPAPAKAETWTPVDGSPHIERNDAGQVRMAIPTRGDGVGSTPGCYCDGCNFWRKLGR